MPLKDRINVCKYYFFKSKNNVSIYELLRFILSPTCKVKAEKLIKNIEKINDNYEIIVIRITYDKILSQIGMSQSSLLQSLNSLRTL